MRNITLHEQVRNEILKKVDSGEYLPGQKLPGERELSGIYGVSRVTVRQALSELIDRGVLIKRQGSGTYVKNKVIQQPMARLCGIVEELIQQNIRVSVEVMEQEYYQYTASMAYLWDKLKLSPKEEIYKVKRKLSADSQALLLDCNYASADIGRKIEALDVNKDVLFKGLEYFGYEIDYAQQVIAAKLVTASQARLLEIRPGSPVLDVERITYSKQGKPLLFTRVTFVGDKYSYGIMLKRNV